MEVTYTLTPEDIPLYYQEMQIARKHTQLGKKPPLSRYARNYFSLYGPILAFYAAIRLFTHGGELALLVTIIVAGIWGPLFSQIATRRYVRYLTQYPGLVGIHLVRLDADGLFHHGQNSEWKLFWPTITEIVALPCFIFFTSDRDVIFGMPKAAFTDAETADGFLGTAQIYWHNARLSWPPPPLPHTARTET